MANSILPSFKNSFINLNFLCYSIAFLTMIIMPVYYWFLPPLMIAWVVIWLLEIKLKLKEFDKIKLTYRILFFLFILFYCWQIFGLVYSDNTEAGLRNIFLRISLLIYPLVLISPGNLIQQNINKLLKIFSLSTLAYLIICFTYALYRSVSLRNGNLLFNPHPPVEDWLNYFYGTEFAIFQHPSYSSIYALFSFYIALEAFFDKHINSIRRVLWLIVSISMLISLYFLSSRAEILATLISLPVYFLYKFRTNNIKKGIGVLVPFLLIFFLIVLPLFKSNPRFGYYLNNSSLNGFSNQIIKESRLGIWKSSLKIANENIVFGVGTGDIQDELNKEYKLRNDKELLTASNLNAHNEILEILLENGLIGVIIFMSVFGMMVYISLKEHKIIYLMFTIIVFISFMFETMLNRLAGVSFFSLFSFLLLYLDKNTPTNQTTKLTQTIDN